MSSVVNKTIRSVLSDSTPTPEPIEQKNIFYVVTGWYPKPKAVDVYHVVDQMALCSVPLLESTDYHQEFKCIFEDSIRGMDEQHYPFRLSVNASIDGRKPLCSLQYNTSCSHV